MTATNPRQGPTSAQTTARASTYRHAPFRAPTTALRALPLPSDLDELLADLRALDTAASGWFDPDLLDEDFDR